MIKLTPLLWLAACHIGANTTIPKQPLGLLDTPVEPVELEHKGVRFTAEIPNGLVRNKEYSLGVGWNGPDGYSQPGPRVTIGVTDRSFANVDAFAAYVEAAPNTANVLRREAGGDGRLRYVRQTLSGQHMSVSEWIPIGAERGLECWASWWEGIVPSASQVHPVPVDAKKRAWLEAICDKVQLLR